MAEEKIQRPSGRMKNHGPYNTDCNHGADIREEKHGPEQSCPLDPHIQRHRKEQGNNDGTRHRNAGINQVVYKRNLKIFIAEHFYIIA